MIKKLSLAGAAASLLFAGAASAADLPARTYYTKAPAPIAAIYNWTGFYVGVNGGYGSSRNCWDFTTPANVFVAAEGCHDATGGTAGGQLGYRWQAGSWVFGVEAQGNWADLSGSNVSAAFPAFINDTRVDAFGLFTGQIGYAINSALIYLKGGAAVVSDRYRNFATATGNQVAFDVNDTRWGGVVGVGLEYGFAPNWSAAIEYDHIFLEDRSYTFLNNGNGGGGAAGTLFGTDSIRQDVDLVTVRVNYRFGGPLVARY
jgi:outer membrane immunogenic protein